MVKPGLGLLSASFHIQGLSHHVLHCGHIIGNELEGLSGLMVYPVPDDVCMVVRFPGLLVSRIFIMALVLMKVDLDGLDASA